MFLSDCVKLLNDVVFCSLGDKVKIKKVVCKEGKFFAQINDHYAVIITDTPYIGRYGTNVYCIRTYIDNFEKTPLFSDKSFVCKENEIEKYFFVKRIPSNR